MPSEISGGTRVRVYRKPYTMQVPQIWQRVVSTSARRPVAYWIPPTKPEVIERLQIHGIRMKVIKEAREVEVDMIYLDNAPHAKERHGFESIRGTRAPRLRASIRATDVEISCWYRLRSHGSALGDLAIVLLDPSSPDSFFQWGFFLEFLTRSSISKRTSWIRWQRQ